MEKLKNPKYTLCSQNLLRPAIIVCVLGLIFSAVASQGLVHNRHHPNDASILLLRAMALDHLGRIYIADPVDNVIRCYSKDGDHICEWGLYGQRDGQFDFPSDIAVDAGGFIYVTDMGNHRIQKFQSDGTFVAKWGSIGTEDGKMDHPSAIAVDSEGFVYVADTSGRRIQKFDPHGKFISKLQGDAANKRQPSRPCWQNPWNTCD
jgi:DNA-binding beta-propeller fold protein YncE